MHVINSRNSKYVQLVEGEQLFHDGIYDTIWLVLFVFSVYTTSFSPLHEFSQLDSEMYMGFFSINVEESKHAF
jgi:hypothetical protein